MDAQSMKFIAVGLMAFGIVGAAIGVGNIFSSYLTAVSRNPSTEGKLFRTTMIGASMVEALGMLALVVAFILIFM